jgi:integrase
MPAAPVVYRGLSWKFNRILLRRGIPKPVQPILGKRMFRVVMPQRDMEAAFVASCPIWDEWGRQIDAAKDASNDHLKAEVIRLRTRYQTYTDKELDDAGREFFDSIIVFLFQTFGGVTATVQRLALADAKGDTETALKALPAPAGALQLYHQISGQVVIQTPFLEHVDKWAASGELRGQHLQTSVAEVKAFAKAHKGCTLQSITQDMVQLWVRELLKPTDGRRPNLPATVAHKLNSLRQYWGWMQGGGLVDKTRKQFSEIKVKDLRSEVEIAEAERQRFTLPELRRILAASMDDPPLFTAIKLAYYTGARRNGVCSLTVNSVTTDEETGIRHFTISEKTRAGTRRKVPVHPAIVEWVDDLIANAKDGYLIHDCEIDVHGYRGNDIGERFSNLRDCLGFDSQRYTYHCIRKTFSHQLGKVGVIEQIINDIAGWETQRMQRHYAGEAELTTKLDALGKLPPL